MATKTLTITEDAYERLACIKEETESFSDVIVKHFPRHSLLELSGIFSSEEANKIREHIEERRKESRKRIEVLAKRLK